MCGYGDIELKHPRKVEIKDVEYYDYCGGETDNVNEHTLFEDYDGSIASKVESVNAGYPPCYYCYKTHKSCRRHLLMLRIAEHSRR